MIESTLPTVVECVLRTDDHAVMVSGGECIRAFITVSPEQIYNYKNGEGLNYVMQITTMLLNPMQNEMTAGQIGRLIITIIAKMGNVLGENVDLLLKAVISKLQLVSSLKAVMNLVVVFAHLFLTQMDAVMNFLSTVPGPSGEPAMQFVFHHWLNKQDMFYGNYERKVTTMALCKVFEYGITTQDNRLTSITVKEIVVVKDDGPPQVRTRSKSRSVLQQTVEIPALVKIFKLLIHELSYYKEGNLDFETDTDAEDDPSTDNIEDEGAAGDGSPRNRFISDLNFNDEDDDPLDDQLMRDLFKDPVFQVNMEEKLLSDLKLLSGQLAAILLFFIKFIVFVLNCSLKILIGCWHCWF